MIAVMSPRAKAALAAVALAVVLAGVGYASVSSSSYKSVSDLLSAKRTVKATLEADVVPLGRGVYTLVIGDKVYSLEARGAYGVVRDPSGKVYAVFLLGDGRHVVLAIYDATDEYMAYQIGSGLSSRVVAAVTYDPGVTAVLKTPDGGEVELPVAFVGSILKGCHASYAQGAATTD